ncbi:D-alanyl-D-alanine carboxypeptidase [Streptomyces sp. NPDC016675]|uniref:D-alanyl-D-alanine carboxypeptidase n=1 Tax=Streptomyces sp. NPDC016675 TaxID=3364970 RepID=UPI0036F5A442
MEEASVAGESPDRSKQRESSEEPTSGSAGPVPEARTEANETPDPRLAVTRETAKPSASAGSAESAGSGASRGGVDTATRVLSVRETDARSEGEDAEPEGAVEEDTPETSDTPASSDSNPSSTSTTSPASSDSGDTSDASGAEPATGGDGRLRHAVAAWVATADERAAANARTTDAEPAEGVAAAEEDGKDPDAPADAPRGADTDADAGTGTGPDADAGTVTDTDADADTEADADGQAGGATGAADGPEEPADGEVADGTGDEPVAATGAGATAEGPEKGAGEAEGGERAVDQPTAVFKAVRPSAPAVDQPTTMLKLGDAAATAGKAKEAKEADQADQAGKTGKGGGAAAPAERDAERTSKFVALRHPDDPATRKPPPEAPRAPQAPRAGVTAAVPQAGPERTTQQPLPPKPPLDLLAELTNTPPPPETPLRTTVRRVKIWTPLVLLLLIVLGVVQSMRALPAPQLDLTAQDSFTFEGGKPEIPWPSSGQAALDVQGIGTFGSSGDQKPVPIASVAKVMTAYVILRDHPLKSGAEGPKIKIDQAAEDQSQAGQESTVNVYEGDSISQREALESILIASANNVARLLARWDAGSEKAFVEKMNAAAEDLGMKNTTYTDPSGLNNTTVSTAVDQVKLGKAAMKEPAFREVAAMMSYDDYKGVNHSNWNHLVGHNDVVGIKTGTTTSALGNLVFAAKKEVGGETRTIVGAVVRQPAGGKDNTILGAALDSSDKLIRAAQDTLESSTILKKGSVVGYVDDGLGGRTPVVATQDVKAVGWPGLTVKLTFTADEVPHTAPAGTKVGALTVGDGGAAGAVKVPVALQEDLVEPALTDKLTRLG